MFVFIISESPINRFGQTRYKPFVLSNQPTAAADQSKLKSVFNCNPIPTCVFLFKEGGFYDEFIFIRFMKQLSCSDRFFLTVHLKFATLSDPIKS